MRMHLVTSVLVLVSMLATVDAAPKGGTVTGRVKVTASGTARKDHAGVVVYLEGVPAPKGQSTAKNAVIRQRDKQFDPPLTIVVKGATVDFPNEDKIFHNVFSVSRPARFDLGLYKSGAQKSVEMKRPGTVDVYCNIHPEMIAKVKVLDNAFYATTDKTGAFTIENVPAGQYPIVAWVPSGNEARGTVTVTDGGRATLELTVADVAAKTAHTRKDGTPYGRYK